MSSTLSSKQIAEAVSMAKDDLIEQLKDKSWSVSSLNSNETYKVRKADSVHAYDLWCTCKGWRFKKGAKDCKHCEAVRIFSQQKNSNKRSKGSITNDIMASPKKLHELNNWWNDLDEVVGDQILHELGYDPDVIESKGSVFVQLGRDLQKKIAEDYFNYDKQKSTISSTLTDVRDQQKDPKDMTLTSQWWDNKDFESADHLADLLDIELDSENYNEWSDLTDEDKWKIHEYRTEQMGISLDDHKPETEKSVDLKNVKVTCWHCGDKNQTIQSQEDAFDCTNCKEPLWVGQGGFQEIKVGVWK